jgi:hypothetical protein|nr:MAG TPA: hypothetical protein [Caudoviricetes sp.]
MSSIKTTQIDGDVSVGRHVAIGGSTTVQGNSQFKGNVKVDGWLEAPNIKSASKGFFRTLEDAQESYPKPENGWWIIVGGLPGKIYAGKDGKWADTGLTGGDGVVLDDYAKKDLSNVDMDKYFRTEVDSEEKLTKAGDAGDASWLETRWDETTFDGKKEAVSRRQMKLGKSAIGVTTDGRAYVEKEGYCKILLTVENLADYAKKDLSNISDTALRDKIHAQEDWVVEYKIDDDHSVSFDADQDAGQMVGATAEDVDKALYFSTTSPSFGSAISPVSARIIYGRESLSYVAMFVGSDDYVHKIVWDEAGNLTKQYAYSLDDFATKEEVESIDFAGYLTSQGYKPTHVIDLGRYENGSFGIDDAWYWGDVQGAIYNYLDGKCNLLLKGASNYNEPRMYTIEGVERDGDTRFTIRFKTSATRVHVISIDEDAYTDEGERVVTQSYIDLGNSGSGTITSSKFSDTEYTEITNNH